MNYKNYYGMLLRCLEKLDVERALNDLHANSISGNFLRDTTTYNVLRDGYYWQTLFKVAHAHVRKYGIFQACVVKGKKVAIILRHITIEKPFKK